MKTRDKVTEVTPRSVRGDRGQSMIVITLALPVLVGIISLATDVGDFYLNRTRMQTATDAAVLSGANYLPAYQSQAISTAQSYAASNGIQSGEIQSTTVSSDGNSITMSVARTVTCYFCSVLGLEPSASTPPGSANITTKATATVVSVNSDTGAVPIAVDYRTSLSYGSTVTLMNGTGGPGNWGALALGGTGASVYQANIQSGYSGTLSAGDMVQTQTGALTGPTKTGIDSRINAGQTQYPAGTFASHALTDPRVVTVPMVDFANINGSAQVPVKGFAVLWLVSANGSGTITAYFLQQVVGGAQVSASAANYGASAPAITQ